MSDVGMPLLVHGEVTDSNIDIFDRERVFIDTILRPVMLRFPLLRIVMEHITTEDAVNFILIENKDNAHIAATITAHHLLYNRNDIFKGGVCPHMFCLPILKREKHRISLLKAATSGSPKFFIGTDSAPHTVTSKESACGCAGETSRILLSSLTLIFISSLSLPFYHLISFNLTLDFFLPSYLVLFYFSLVSFPPTFLPPYFLLFTFLSFFLLLPSYLPYFHPSKAIFVLFFSLLSSLNTIAFPLFSSPHFPLLFSFLHGQIYFLPSFFSFYINVCSLSLLHPYIFTSLPILLLPLLLLSSSSPSSSSSSCTSLICFIL